MADNSSGLAASRQPVSNRGADLALAGVDRHRDLLQHVAPRPRAAAAAAAAAAGPLEAAAAARSLVGETLVRAFFHDMKEVSTHKVGLRNAFDVTLIDKLSDVVRQELIQTADAGSGVEGDAEEFEGSCGKRVTFSLVSSAVEGASKVYGYRVEAVYDQTYHLLNGLATLRSSAATGAPDEEEEQQQLKRRSRQQQQRLAQFSQGSSSTLGDPKDITSDQLDTGVLVDPFFVKMAGLFDQAGAKGLLLSNLQVDENLCLRFDGEAPAFPTATATAASAANACTLDAAAVADLVLGQAESSPIDTSICSEALQHFSQQIKALRDAADGAPPPGAEADKSIAAAEGEKDESQGEDGGDDLLLGFQPDAAAEQAANIWEQQQEMQQQHHEQEQQQQQQQDMLLEPQDQQQFDDDGGVSLDFAADDFTRQEDLSVPERLDSLLASPPEGGNLQGFRDFERLLTSSFLSNEGLGFRRFAVRRPAAVAAAAGDEAATTAAGKTQQILLALDPFLVDTQNLTKQITMYPLLKAERCMPPVPKLVDSVFVASDMTSSPFAPSPQQMLSLSLLSSKQLQLSGDSNQTAALVDAGARDTNGAEMDYEDVGFGASEDAFELPSAAATNTFVSRLFDSRGLGYDANGLSFVETAQKFPASDLRLSLPSRYVDVAVVKETLRQALGIAPKQETEKETDAKEETPEEADNDDNVEFSRLYHTTSSLLPAVEKRNCSPQMLFVCLLYTANDEALFLSPSSDRETFFVRRAAPLAEQLADDWLAEAALQSVASYPPMDLQKLAEETPSLLPTISLDHSPLLQQYQQKHQQQHGKKRRRDPSPASPNAATAAADELKPLQKKNQQQQQQKRQHQETAVTNGKGQKSLKRRLRKRRSSSSSSSSSGSDNEEVFT